MEWSRKWLVDFNAGKAQLLLFDWSTSSVAILMWKWMGLFLRKNNLLRCYGWISLPNWIGILTLSLLLKLSLRKLEAWFVLWIFFIQRLPCISINLLYLAWNTAVMTGLVLLVAAWNFYISYKTDMQECWSFTYCLSWTLGSSSECSEFKSFLQVLLW